MDSLIILEFICFDNCVCLRLAGTSMCVCVCVCVILCFMCVFGVDICGVDLVLVLVHPNNQAYCYCFV